MRSELREASGNIRQCGGGKSALARRMAGLTRLPLHVIDMIQFFVKMTAVIAAAWFAVKHVGGMQTLVSTLADKTGLIRGARVNVRVAD